MIRRQYLVTMLGPPCLSYASVTFTLLYKYSNYGFFCVIINAGHVSSVYKKPIGIR